MPSWRSAKIALCIEATRFGSCISDDCSITKPILRVRNESICYEVFVDRTKPDNSVRINPAARHSETKYGFIILTGDMIFEHFFVAVKLLLRHEHLSSAAANTRQNQLTCHVLKTKLRGGRPCSPFDRRSEQFASIGVADLLVDRRSTGRPGLNFASVGQASDSGSSWTWRTNRPVDSADHTCGDYSVCHHVSLMVGNMNQPSIR